MVASVVNDCYLPHVSGVVPLLLVVASIALTAPPSPDTTVIELGPSTSTTAAVPTGMALEDLVAEALSANVQIHIDRVRISEARALSQLATAQMFPKGSIQAIFGGPTPEAKTRTVNDLSTTTDASLENDFDFGQLGISFRGGGQLVQPVFTFGQITAAKDAAEHAVRAAEIKVDITSADVVALVHEAYWAFQLTHSFEESLSEGVGILASVLEKVEELLENDSPQVTENDRLRLIHAHATVKVRQEEALIATQLALRAMRLLIGRAQTTPLEIALVDIEHIPTQPPTVDTMLTSAVERRPELQALRALIAGQERFIDFRYNQLFPTFFIGGFLDWAITTNATDQTNPFLKDDFNFFSAGVGLGLRLELDVFHKLAVAQQAEAELGTRTAQMVGAAQAIDLEVRASHAELAGSYAQLPLLERALGAARGWLNTTVLAYDIGIGDAGELIDAFIARATAEGELKQTYYLVHVGWASLDKAAGRLVDRDVRHN